MAVFQFQVHSLKQEIAIKSKKKILLLATGTQWGKTSVGAIRMKRMMHTFKDKDDAFLITSPTYKTLHQSTLPAFLKIMDGLGRYDKKFDAFRMFNGGICYCRTETDPDSIVGITNVKHIWADEAGKYGKYFWENMQARADFCGCCIDLTTSPYSLNWIFKELIKPTQKGLRDDVEYVTAASWENPYHSLSDEAKRLEKERTMDSRRFRMIFGGLFEKMEGLVYDCFDENIHVCNSFALPSGTKYYCGIDWGFYPDPFVLSIRAVTPGNKHYQVAEFVKTRLTLSDQITAAKQKQTIWGIERFYADPSQPGAIEEFCRNGLPTIPAENSIRIGIDTHYELIKSGEFKIFKDTSPYTLDEYSTYHYGEETDLKPDQDSNPKDQLPVGQYDHCIEENELVQTIHGPKKIKDICVNDLVLTRNGFKKVTHVWDNGIKDVIEINLDNGVSIKCTNEHMIYTLGSGFKKAHDLTDQDMLCVLNAWQTKKLSTIVLFVVKHLFATNIIKHTPVLNHARLSSKYKLSQKSKVYDLTVDGEHEYFVNGILVHNCMDATRYLTMALNGFTKKSPHVPGDNEKDKLSHDNMKRIAALKKQPKKYQNESWS